GDVAAAVADTEERHLPAGARRGEPAGDLDRAPEVGGGVANPDPGGRAGLGACHGLFGRGSRPAPRDPPRAGSLAGVGCPASAGSTPRAWGEMALKRRKTAADTDRERPGRYGAHPRSVKGMHRKHRAGTAARERFGRVRALGRGLRRWLVSLVVLLLAGVALAVLACMGVALGSQPASAQDPRAAMRAPRAGGAATTRPADLRDVNAWVA